MTGRLRAWFVVAALALSSAGCGNGGSRTTPEPETTSADDSCQVDERFCNSFRRMYVVRSAIYGPPFDETPDEIEALMAESDALMAEIRRLCPHEIRAPLTFTLSGFAEPIDAMTEELGWDPDAAINTDEALAIFADAELDAATVEVDAYMERCCPVEEDLAAPTDPITLGDRSIAVYNGTPALNEALTWGLERFEIAGLESPPIGSATFTVQSAMCDEIRGRYLPTERGIELELCMDEGSMCWEDPDAEPEGCAGHCPAHLPGMMAVVLHEIAHGWLDTNTDTVDTERFLEHVGLEAWRDRALPWVDNGVEHAADTIAWGLMDRDIEMLRIGQPTTEHLVEGFRILTGLEPLPKDA